MHAQNYPNKPVRFIVPQPPGGGADIVGRVAALKLQEALGQQFVVDNRSGAGGIVGAELVARAPADGYTLLLGYTGVLTIMPSLHRNLTYRPLEDFSPVSVVGTQQWVELIREATDNTHGDARKAKDLHNRFAVPLMDGIYEYQLQKTPVSTCAANKEALLQMGEIASSWVRPPALNVTQARRDAIRDALQKSGLLMAKAAVGM